MRATDLATRFWAKVQKTDGCWLWTGYVKPSGHGQINRGRRGEGAAQAHVVAWELLVGPVPKGRVLHHKCGIPSCVNPAHLAPVTPAEHTRIHAAARTECYYGHPLDGRVRHTGTRFCRTCRRQRDRAYYRKRKGHA